MRRYETAPHPLILEPGDDGALEYKLVFGLVGGSNRHVPLLIHAMMKASEGRRGVGGNIMRLVMVEQETVPGSGNWQHIYSPSEPVRAMAASYMVPPPSPDSCRIQLLTPLRVKRDGRHVGPERFRFADLFGHLLRRVSMLMAFHTESELKADFRGLMWQAGQIEASMSLKWQDQPRYSFRQGTAMLLGGVVGHIDLHDVDLEPFWPYLWLGQWLHAGSGATMGLGQYRIETTSLSRQPLTQA